MKKITLVLIGIGMSMLIFAGGMQHNTNHSAQWVRMLARDASTGIDAVFYNPAGLTKLTNGFHLSINNQTLKQTRTVSSENPFLNNPKYEGSTFVPVLPSLFAAYKFNKLALSGGFMVVGGGGTADFENGVPTFESDIAMIPTLLTSSGIPTSDYTANLTFSKSSAFYGIQVGASYALNEMLGVYVGGRYIIASGGMNNINGSVSNIMINPNYPAFGAAYDGGMVPAPQFFSDAATTLNTLAAGADGFYDGLEPIIDAGAGGILLSNGTAAGLTNEQVGQIQQIVAAAGQDPTTMDIATARIVLGAAVPVFEAKADAMEANAIATADKEIEVEQSGTGFTPIVGANLSLMESRLNIGLKYEFATELVLTNNTLKDDIGIYPDNAEYHSDLPAMFTAGADFQATNKLGIALGYHQYFDKSVKYFSNDLTNDEYLEGNAFELSAGLEYAITKKLLISTGYLYAAVQKKDLYQSDLSNNLSSSTIGFGGQYGITQNLDLNLGMLITLYEEANNAYDPTATPPIYKETYGRTNLLFAVGLGFRLGQ